VNPLSPRMFARRVVTALIVVVVVSVAAFVGANIQAARKVSQIAKAPIDPSVLQGGGNFLLIGSDTRSFVDSPEEAQHFGSAQAQTGQRSDTIMVAHVDDGGKALLVSFPRDLWVDIPGIGGAKINAAFNAGPQRVIETIQGNFDVPISHYLQIDFAGFREMVDAIGTVPINFPAPARDIKSGLAIAKAGCIHLDGDQALAYVRSRFHEQLIDGKWQADPTSDLGRIQRQQYFLRTLAQQTLRTATRSPWRANSIADTLVRNLERDPDLGLGPLRKLARAFDDAANVQTVTLPTNRQFIDGQDALVLDDAKAAPLFARLRSDNKEERPKAPEGVDPGDVRITVENGSGRAGLAGGALDDLRDLGFAVEPPAANADRSDYAETEVRYAPGAEDKGKLVRASLNAPGRLVELDEGASGGADVVLVLGRDYRGVRAGSTPATSAKRAPAASTPGTTAAAPRPVGC
jgi:polyisoprenyl-teichoic acid--peptidoglycan teichoic acid transferase